jgi:hypothetical protein
MERVKQKKWSEIELTAQADFDNIHPKVPSKSETGNLIFIYS